MKRRLFLLSTIFSLFYLGLWAQTTQADSTVVVAVEELPATDSVSVFIDAPLADFENPKKYIIRDIKALGIKYLNTDILIASSGLSVGDEVYLPSAQLSKAISRLWSQRYFADIQLLAEPVGDSLNLVFNLTERPRVYRWNFEGIRNGEASTLTDNLKLKRGGSELSDYVLDRNIYAIKQHYIEKGYRNVTVTPRIQNDSVIRNAVNVTFVVSKNERVRIGEIRFEGNEIFSDKRLRRVMKKINQKSINFFENTKLKDEGLEEDFDNLLDFYNSRGYRNAVILKDSVYTISPNRIGLVITLDEGSQYYYRNIKWIGNSKFKTEMLDAMLGIKPGDLYDKKTLNERLGFGKEDNPEDVSTVNSLYQNDGYLGSQIDPSEIIVGKDSIDLEIKIFEGSQYRFNNVNIIGNDKVDDEVIRRDIDTRPGDLYNRAMIMATMRQLAAMGHFDETQIMPNIQPVSSELVDISWSLSEKASDKFELSGGWGGGMFVGSVGIVLTNLSIGDFFKKDAWRPYPHGRNQQLSLRAQTNGTYYSAFSVGFVEPWLGGKKPSALNISAYWSEETTDYSDYQGDVVRRNQYFRAMGVAVGIGRRLSWPDRYFTLYTELGYKAYQLKDWNYFAILNDENGSATGMSNIITLRAVLSRNSTNSPIYPSSGSEFNLSLTLTPPYSLFNNTDYSKITNKTEKYKWVEYHKWELDFRWFYPLTMDGKLVLMTKAEMGYLGHYDKNKTSPFEGFEVGGDGMSGYNQYGVDIISVRGYEDGSLTPSHSNTYANLYSKYTVEVRYPIIMQPSTQLFGLVFAEAGNAWMSWKDFNPFQLKRSLGVGLRLYMPIVGMLGIDWGYGFDKAFGQSKNHGAQFHFMIGQEF